MTTNRLLADHARDLAALHDRVTASQHDLAQRQLALADAEENLRQHQRELRERQACLDRQDYGLIEREVRAALDDDEPLLESNKAIDPAQLRAARALAAEIIRCGKIRRAEIEPPPRQPKTRAEVLAALIIDAAAKARGQTE
jgi:hypothetical protein